MLSNIQELHLPASNRHCWQKSNIQVWRLNTSELNSNTNLALLSVDEQRRAERFKLESRRLSFVITRIALRLLLAERLQCAPETIEFRYNETGCPEIKTPKTSLQFSVSHSASMSLITLTNSNPVGIDVELHDDSLEPLIMATALFSQAEITLLKNCEPLPQLLLFYKLWTAKEAVLKMIGSGFSTDPRLVCLAETILDNDGSSPVVLALDNKQLNTPIKQAQLIKLELAENYTATLALGSLL